MWTDDELRTYVPEIYQRSIFAINYARLRDAGINLISYDIDDTLADLLESSPSDAVEDLFAALKDMGFTVVLLSNTYTSRAEHYAHKLGIAYFSKAQKPFSNGFQAALNHYNKSHDEQITPKMMAHVGNSITADVKGGNDFGAVTCLVRNMGITAAVGTAVGKIFGGFKENKELRDELKKRGMWREHHQFQKGDQYYQYGETQRNNG